MSLEMIPKSGLGGVSTKVKPSDSRLSLLSERTLLEGLTIP